jgi:hypothetical protein
MSGRVYSRADCRVQIPGTLQVDAVCIACVGLYSDVYEAVGRIFN